MVHRRIQMTARHVLVVDDDPANREGLTILLELWGHRVDQAASGKQALARVSAERPDVVLLDIGLPDLNGVEVARRIRENVGGPLFMVALTGHAEADAPSPAPFDRYMQKPVDCDALKALIAAVQL
jgi:CheY-like chemotaxis protein